MKGFTKDGKFHPITEYKGVRKSRDQSTKEQGVKIRKAREVKNWKQLDNYDPKFMRFMNRVDKTSAGGLEDLIFEPIGEKYVDTGGGYNLHEKNNFDDIIDYSLAHDGQGTLDEYKKIFVKYPEIVKEFMKPYKVRASNYEAKIKARNKKSIDEIVREEVDRLVEESPKSKQKSIRREQIEFDINNVINVEASLKAGRFIQL